MSFSAENGMLGAFWGGEDFMMLHVVLYSFRILVAFLYIPYGNDLLHISNKQVAFCSFVPRIRNLDSGNIA